MSRGVKTFESGGPIEDEIRAVSNMEPMLLTPEERFAEHVETVRKDGDIVDATKWAYSLWYRKATIAAGAAAAGQVFSVAPVSLTKSLAVFSLPIAMLARSYYRSRQAEDRRDKYLADDMEMEELGQGYELYRVRDRRTDKDEVVMRWYGSVPLEEADEKSGIPTVLSAADSLQRVADLARDNNIPYVLVEPRILQKVIDIPEPGPGEPSSRDPVLLGVGALLKRQKGYSPDFFINDEKVEDINLLAYQPDGLESLGRRIRTVHEITPSLQRMVDVLRSRSPQHPLLKVYDDFAGSPELLYDKLAKRGRTAVEARLSDVAAEGRTSRFDPPGKNKISMAGRLQDDASVQWHVNGKLRDKQGFEGALGLTKQQIQQMMAHPELYSNRPYEIVRAAEAGIYLAARKLIEVQDEAENKPLVHITSDRPQFLDLLDKSLTSSRPIQYLDYNNHGFRRTISADKRRTKKFLSSMALAATSFVAGVAGDIVLDDVASSRDTAIYNTASGSQAGPTSIISDEILKQYATFRKNEEAFLDWLPTSRITSDGSGKARDGEEDAGRELGDRKTSGVGNVDLKNSHITDWHVQAPPGLSTAGYWSEATSYQLGNPSDGWSVDLPDPIDTPALPTTITAEQKDRTIEVSRRLSRGDISMNSFTAPNPYGSSYNIMHIPVLDGTRPVAAQLGGQPVEIDIKEDGTYAVIFRGDQASLEEVMPDPTLKYWLEPGQSMPVHATEQLKITKLGPKGDVPEEWNPKVFIEKWKQVYPELSGSSFIRPEQQAAYLQERFQYASSPLTKELSKDMEGNRVDWPEFFDRQFPVKQANCNVARTLIGLSNPTLNEAHGYRNDGDNTLIRKEYHAWLVNPYGDKIEGTPLPPDVTELRMQEEAARKRQLLVGLGLLTASSVVVATGMANRRRIRGVVAAASTRLAAHQLAGLPAEALEDAKQTADMALFAPEFDAAKLRPTEEPSRDKALADLTQPQLHDPSVQERLRAVEARQQDGQSKALIRDARRILRTVQRAGLAQQYKVQKSAADIL